MTIEEIRKIKKEISKNLVKMTPAETNEHYKKISEDFMKRLGRENFIPTDKPNVWKHIPKKTADM